MRDILKPLKIYNASAGSGKTYTLVQEYLRIVLNDKDPSKFRSILAMTFTNKAANEMKERIINALIDLKTPPHLKTEKQSEFLIQTAKNLNLSPKLIEERSEKIANKILHDYSSFSVLTIDKFTHKIIRTFAKDLNISIDFDVELNESKLRKNVTDLLIDQIGRNKELTRLMFIYAQDNLADEKSWNFSKQVYDFCSVLFKENAHKSILKLKDFNEIDFLNTKNEIIKENSIFEKMIIEQASMALDIVDKNNLSSDDFQGKSRGVLSFFTKIKNKEFQFPSDAIHKNVEEDKWAHPSSVNKSTVEHISSDLNKIYNQIFSLLESQFPNYKLNKEILKNLNNLSLLNHLLKLLEQIKEEENILLISDFYKKIADIIVEEPVPYIYERLGVRYSHFLLDEFQDTSQLQWINMIPLIHNSISFGHQNLIVGDGKQAIYRWRNGEVEQFTQLPNQIYNPEKIETLSEAEILFKEMGEKIVLHENYRSAKEIIDFNNSLFTHLSENLGENLKYIYDEVKQNTTKKFRGFVEAFFNDELEQEEQFEYIENTIIKSLKQGFELKDICIIVRKNDVGAKIANFLTEKNYPIISSESLFVGNDISVKLLVNIMKSFANSQNANYRIKSAEHWARLNQENVTEFVLKHESILKSDSIISFFKTKNILLEFPNQFHNLFDFTEHLIEKLDLDISNNAYLQFFLEQVFQYEINQNSALIDFLFWFDEMGWKKSIVIPEGANAIQITTIHKSKGLQFPIVICPFYDWKTELHKQISWINDDNEKLPAFFLNMTSAVEETKFEHVFTEEKEKLHLDELNLLYVAFTRAEKALFISFNSKLNLISKDWLKPFFENETILKKENNSYTIGNFDNLVAENNIKSSTEFHADYLKQVMNKPKLSFKSGINWEKEEGIDEKRNFGIQVHKILSKIKHRTEIVEKVHYFAIKEELDIDEEKKLVSYIENLFLHLHFLSYFEFENVMNEKEIIDANADKLIPDKIIFEKDFTLIVDFKTGQKTPSHKKQMLSYIGILTQMDYPNVRGEIFYTELMECELI